MDERLKSNQTPEKRMTPDNLRRIQLLAKEKYGNAYFRMSFKQIIDENPDWVEELEMPINLRGQVITSEKSLRGIEAAAEMNAVIETSRRNFMNKKPVEKRDSVPPS